MTENVPSTNLLPSQVEFNMFATIAKNAQDSGLYSGIGGQAKIFMILLAARELGISPMLALNGGIWNIQGKIEISSRLMNSLIRRAGHTMQITSTQTECVIKARRSDTGEEHTEKFTWAMAERAGLTKGNVWQKYPEDMLYNRCMSRLARRLFPDVIGTAYVEGEIREIKEFKEDNLSPSEYEDVTEQKDDGMKPVVNNWISKEQIQILAESFEKCTDEYRKNFWAFAQNTWKIKGVEEMKESQFKSAMQSITNHLQNEEAKKATA